jgi:hypothetical protein
VASKLKNAGKEQVSWFFPESAEDDIVPLGSLSFFIYFF